MTTAETRRRNGSGSVTIKEIIMKRLLYSGAILVMLGSAGVATAQNANNAAQTNNAHPNLNPAQQQMVSNSLSSTPSQSAPSGAQPQVGDKVPDSMTAQSMPNNVSENVPEVKQLLFVKLPDRILLIDPDTQLIGEIVAEPATTGSATGSQDRQNR
jgi:23S rRNA G2445 N2-methylase RlmL